MLRQYSTVIVGSSKTISDNMNLTLINAVRCLSKEKSSYTTKLIQQFATIFGGVANKRAGIDGNRHDCRMWQSSSCVSGFLR
jgi:hypothetical protein